ncbi:MAG: CCA tRNA nucleotidyltransferase [Acidimicrobiia bacterium]|nr:CCA tRNA nucleotidyltransferase [Acidimicrobiia bacterium]
MSDYMFMLESHLSPEQNQVVSQVAAAAEKAGVTAFVSGGALRDMMGGFPIRDLDFTVEGNALKVAKLLTDQKAAKVVSKDDTRKAASLRFANGVESEIAMAQEARYGKAGSKPKVVPVTIHEDLRSRDFTINSVALSLNPGSRGLLLDPSNGLGDLERRELRANSNYTLYDDPSRILRLWRLAVRMDLSIEDRTRSQYENVREAGLEKKIPTKALLEELRKMADEPNPGALLEVLDREGLLSLFSPALTGAKINQAGFSKFQQALQAIPFGAPFPLERLGLFLFLLTEKFTAKERSQLILRLKMPKSDVTIWQKLEGRAKKLQQTLKSAKLKKASLIYDLLQKTPGDEILFLYMRSPQRLVHDRIKTYLQKSLPAVQEVTDRDVAQHRGVEPGEKKFAEAKRDYIVAKLDGRIRKPAPVEEAPPPAASASGRR